MTLAGSAPAFQQARTDVRNLSLWLLLRTQLLLTLRSFIKSDFWYSAEECAELWKAARCML